MFVCPHDPRPQKSDAKTPVASANQRRQLQLCTESRKNYEKDSDTSTKFRRLIPSVTIQAQRVETSSVDRSYRTKTQETSDTTRRAERSQARKACCFARYSRSSTCPLHLHPPLPIRVGAKSYLIDLLHGGLLVSLCVVQVRDVVLALICCRVVFVDREAQLNQPVDVGGQ